jgi:hypothetical protein
MSSSTYFSQGCPTCGRNLLIRVEYLGKKLVCQHCRGELYARDPASARIDETAYYRDSLRRADELIASVDRRCAQLRESSPR